MSSYSYAISNPITMTLYKSGLTFLTGVDHDMIMTIITGVDHDIKD